MTDTCSWVTQDLNSHADVVLAHLDRSSLTLPCHPARTWVGKGTRLWGAWSECPSGQRETTSEAGDPKAGEKTKPLILSYQACDSHLLHGNQCVNLPL